MHQLQNNLFKKVQTSNFNKKGVSSKQLQKQGSSGKKKSRKQSLNTLQKSQLAALRSSQDDILKKSREFIDKRKNNLIKNSSSDTQNILKIKQTTDRSGDSSVQVFQTIKNPMAITVRPLSLYLRQADTSTFRTNLLVAVYNANIYLPNQTLVNKVENKHPPVGLPSSKDITMMT